MSLYYFRKASSLEELYADFNSMISRVVFGPSVDVS